MTLLCGSEQLLGSLPEVKWAKQTVLLATELQDQCLSVIVTNLAQVSHTQAFHSLRRVREDALMTDTGHVADTHTYTQHTQRLTANYKLIHLISCRWFIVTY